MESEHQHLRELLEQVQSELNRGAVTDERSRQLLLDVHQDIARAVDADAPADAPREQGQLQTRLQEAAVEFEGSHPQLASTLERMMVVLSNMGL